MPPATLGPYTLHEKIGSGGMGEVYRARDSRLNRTVALKLLPDELAADRAQLQRFEREARAASSLNHPHIVSIFDAGETDGTAYMAMEMVDGVPLTEWVARQRPPLGRILEVFTQVADALGAAHGIGLIHRDVKGTNILVNSQGYAKVLDFGLAKIVAAEPASETATHLVTQAGVILGTVAYMSPEQAMGLEVDARTDIFSLGVLLFEAISGKNPFSRETPIDTLHAIVHDPPPELPAAPTEFRWILGKALAKDRDERYQSMREFGADLRRLRRSLDTAKTPAIVEAVEPKRKSRAVPWLIAAVTALGLFAGWAIGRRTASVPAELSTRIARLTPLTTDAGFEGSPTFSPDGKLIAYVSDRTGNFDIFLKRIDGGPDLQLTKDPADDVQAAFSPDGSEIAFVSGRTFPGGIVYPSPAAPLIGGDIWVMPALGGEPRKIATGNHPAWLPDGSGIVYSSGRWFERKLLRVARTGGQPVRIPLTPGGGHAFNEVTRPAVSPNGRWLAFESDMQVFVVPMAGGTPSRVVAGMNPAWAPDGTALYFTSADPNLNGGLGRVRVNEHGEAVGNAEMILVGAYAGDTAVARDGLHIAFEADIVRANVEELPFDAEGRGEVLGSRPRPLTTGNEVIFFFSLSPDERTLVYAARQRIWKLEAGHSPVPLTDGTPVADTQPRWSPDGRLIAFARGSSAARAMSAASLWVMNPDGSNPHEVAKEASMNGFFGWAPDGTSLIAVDPRAAKPNERQFRKIDLVTGKSELLTSEPGLLGIGTESHDGSWLALQATNPKTGDVDLRALPTDGSLPSRLVASTPGDDVHPMFSPSGRWLYWIVDHQNLFRVPGPAQDWRAARPEQVTSFARTGLFLEDPQLSPDGRKLLYARRERTADLWLMELATDAKK